MQRRIELIYDSIIKNSAELRRLAELGERVIVNNRRLGESNNTLARTQQRVNESFGDTALKITGLAVFLESYRQLLSNVAIETAMLAARNETLAVVTDNLARVNNLYVSTTREVARAVRDQGITTQQSLSVVNRMIQAELSLSKAAELARLSQDSAVIANMNSSQALAGIIHGIVTRQPEVLRVYGLMVDFQRVYNEESRKLGRELTQAEKTQAGLNEVLRQGAKIAGTYEAAMGTVGKQISSLPRYFEEARYAIGENFQSELKAIVGMLGQMAKFAQENADTIAVMTKAVISLTAALGALVAVQHAANMAMGGGVAAGLKTALGLGAGAAQVGGMAAMVSVGVPMIAGGAALAAGMHQQEQFRAANALPSIRNPQEFAKSLDELTKKMVEGKASARELGLSIQQALAGKERLPWAQENGLFDATTQNPQYKAFLERLGIPLKKYEEMVKGTGGTMVEQSFQRRFNEQQASTVKNFRGIQIEDVAAKEIDALIGPERRLSMAQKELADAIEKQNVAGVRAAKARVEQLQRELKLWEEQKALREKMGKLELPAGWSDKPYGIPGFEGDQESGFRSIQKRAVSLNKPGKEVWSTPFFTDTRTHVGPPPSLLRAGEKPPISPEELDRQRQQQRAAIEQELTFQTRKVQLLVGPGGELEALNRVTAMRLSALEELKKRGLDVHQAELQMTQVRQDRELQLLEIRNRGLQQYQSSVAQAYDALRRGGRDGARSFALAQFDGVARNVLTNAAGLTYGAVQGRMSIPGQTKEDGSLNLFGKLLQNTPLGVDPTKGAIDLNTRSTDRNTFALDNLQQALSRVGNAGAPGAGGLGAVSSAIAGVAPFLTKGGVSIPKLTGFGPYGPSFAPAGSTPAGGGSWLNSFGRVAGLGAAGAASAFGMMSAVRMGGARGALTGLGSVAGGAAAILPALSPMLAAAGPIGGVVAMAAGVATLLFKDPKVVREREMADRAAAAEFKAPVGANYDVDARGHRLSLDRFGNTRVGDVFVYNIQAADAQSFLDRRSDILAAQRAGMREDPGAIDELRAMLFPQ